MASGGSAGQSAAAAGHFGDRMDEAVERLGSSLVVGLDPDPARFPPGVSDGARDARAAAASVARFCREVIDAVSGVAVAVKPQSACFERFGAPGVEALMTALSHAKDRGLLAILDVKRGDIGSTARFYADAYLGIVEGTAGPLTDAITVNPLLGSDSVAPFLDCAQANGKGIFILVKTSNPSSVEIQDLRAGGIRVYEHLADRVAAWGEGMVGRRGLSSVGAVVGATHPEVFETLRVRMPWAPFLVPGFGAQGGKPEELRAAFLPGGRGVLANASRSIIYAFEGEPGPRWQDAVRGAAVRMRDALRAAAG